MKVNIQGLKNKRQKSILIRFCKRICKTLPSLRKKGEISLIFLSNSEIQKVNRKFLNHNYPTDVISFSYFFDPSKEEAQPFGDIYISIDIAKREAKRGKYMTVQELALYALHGMLHLIGFEDYSVKSREKMFAEQSRIFRKVAPDLAPPDFI